MATTITYKGNTLASFSNNTKTLKTRGKYMEDDVVVSSSITLDTATVIPSESTQTITPNLSYEGLSSVTVTGITNTYVGSSVPRKTSSDITGLYGRNQYQFTIPAGYYQNNASAIVPGYTGITTITPSDTTQTLNTSGKYNNSNIVVQPVGFPWVIPSGTYTITSVDTTTIFNVSSYQYADVQIPSGSGDVVVQPNKDFIPTELTVQVVPDPGFDALRKVTVAGITNTYVGIGITRQSATTIIPSETAQTITSGKYLEGNIIISGITSTYVGSDVTRKNSETFIPSTTNQTIAANQYLTGVQTIQGDADLIASNIKHDVNLFNVMGTFGMKMESINSAPASRGTTISFTGLKAQPKAFVCNLEFEGSFTSARTVYSMIYDGTTLSNCTSYRSGSTMLCYKYTTCTWSYNNGTLTITSPSTSTVGYFQPYNYHFIYFYEE